jgi:hypothetical protein
VQQQSQDDGDGQDVTFDFLHLIPISGCKIAKIMCTFAASKEDYLTTSNPTISRDSITYYYGYYPSRLDDTPQRTQLYR